MMKRIPRLALLGLGFVVMLAVTFAMVPPESAQSDVVAPAIAAAVLMLFCGPYLLAVGCTTGFLPDFGSFLGVVAMVPFCALHIAFLSVLSKRTSLWRRMGRFGECARKSAVAALAFVSIAGAWYEMPCVTRYDVSVDGGKVPTEGLRFALVTDLHSCRYGAGQRVLSESILSLNPDAILLSGDIFDDRLPDDNAKAFLAAVARERPCFYAFGNHEHWSERVCGPSSGGPAPSERLLFPRRAGGAYRLNDTTTMVVSRGLARESTPLPRFFNHPELVVIDVKPR